MRARFKWAAKAHAAQKVSIPLLVFIGLSLFLLRGTLGTAGILAFDDLIPLFHPSQIWDFMFQPWNEYYQRPEVRGRYSLIWTPLRYAPLIPWGLLFTSIMVGLSAYGLAAHLCRRLERQAVPLQLLAPIFGGSFYLLMVFSSKAHQLHTLFVGAGLFPLMLLAFLKALEVKKLKSSLPWAAAAALLLLINPSIHLVLLGYGTTLLLVPFHLSRDKLWTVLNSLAIVTLLGLVPYSIWLALSSSSPATAAVPFGLVKAWSGTLLERLLIPIGLSLPETQASGAYAFAADLMERYPGASALFALYTLLGLSALWLWRRQKLVWALGLLWALSIFMATGVQYEISGYRVLMWLAGSQGLPAEAAGEVLTVLRNPDRWLFPALLALALLGSCALYKIFALLRGANLPLQAGVGFIAFGVLAAPFLLHPGFQPIFSGDLGGVLRPAQLPQAYLEALKIIGREKTLYLPIMGTRRLKWNHLRKTQDEVFALLHGGPSIEGATGSPLINQQYLGFAYFELLYKDKARHLGRYLGLAKVRYVLFHDDVEDPFFPDEFSRVLQALKDQRDLKLIYKREGIYLFENLSVSVKNLFPLGGLIVTGGGLADLAELLELGVDPRRVGLLHAGEGDLGWEELEAWAEQLGDRLILLVPQAGGREGLEDLMLSLLTRHVGVAVYPRPGWEESAEAWVSHRELNIHVVSFARFAEKYGLFGVEDALGHKVIATDQEGATFKFEFEIADEGHYKLYIRAAGDTKLAVEVDGGLYLKELGLETRSYRFLPIEVLFLRPGRHTIAVRNLSNSPLVINLAYLIPPEELAHYRGKFEQLVEGVRIAAPDEILAVTQGLRGVPGLYGYYGELFWERRVLEGMRPYRSWLVGSLYFERGER